MDRLETVQGILFVIHHQHSLINLANLSVYYVSKSIPLPWTMTDITGIWSGDLHQRLFPRSVWFICGADTQGPCLCWSSGFIELIGRDIFINLSKHCMHMVFDLQYWFKHGSLLCLPFQTPEEIKEYREKKLNSPWRNRPIEESLKLFDEMKGGIIEEGKATLRMKQDMQNDNYNMYDLIAYRIKASLPPKTSLIHTYIYIYI